MLKGLKSYQPQKKCETCFTKEIYTFKLWWLVTFEPSEQKQRYVPLSKVLMCGMNGWGVQWRGGIFTMQYTSLKMTVLLHKTAHVNFPMATTLGISILECQMWSWFLYSLSHFLIASIAFSVQVNCFSFLFQQSRNEALQNIKWGFTKYQDLKYLFYKW